MRPRSNPAGCCLTFRHDARAASDAPALTECTRAAPHATGSRSACVRAERAARRRAAPTRGRQCATSRASASTFTPRAARWVVAESVRVWCARLRTYISHRLCVCGRAQRLCGDVNAMLSDMLATLLVSPSLVASSSSSLLSSSQCVKLSFERRAMRRSRVVAVVVTFVVAVAAGVVVPVVGLFGECASTSTASAQSCARAAHIRRRLADPSTIDMRSTHCRPRRLRHATRAAQRGRRRLAHAPAAVRCRA